MRHEFAECVKKLVRSREDIQVLLGDIGVGAFRDEILNFPTKITNVGILEQSMVSFASGLALGGKRVVLHSIATFLIGRAYEQIKIDFGYRGLPGLFVSVGASFDYGQLGCTHHAPEDVLLFSSIPGTNIFIPGNGMEVEPLINNHFAGNSLDYLRLSSHQHQYGCLENLSILHECKNPKATLIAIGPMVDGMVGLANKLQLDLIYLNTLNLNIPIRSYIKTRKLFIIEPFYRATTQLLLEDIGTHHEIVNLGVPLTFQSEYMNYTDRHKSLHLDATGVERRIRRIIE